MAVNRCVICGAVMPEGNHICKFCLENTVGENILLTQNTVGKKLYVTDGMLNIKLDPVMLSFQNFYVKIENAATLLETLFKYYIFKTNMNAEGQFNYRFIWKNITPGETIRDTEDRLLSEYTGVIKIIESMIIEK